MMSMAWKNLFLAFTLFHSFVQAGSQSTGGTDPIDEAHYPTSRLVIDGAPSIEDLEHFSSTFINDFQAAAAGKKSFRTYRKSMKGADEYGPLSVPHHDGVPESKAYILDIESPQWERRSFHEHVNYTAQFEIPGSSAIKLLSLPFNGENGAPRVVVHDEASYAREALVHGNQIRAPWVFSSKILVTLVYQQPPDQLPATVRMVAQGNEFVPAKHFNRKLRKSFCGLPAGFINAECPAGLETPGYANLKKAIAQISNRGCTGTLLWDQSESARLILTAAHCFTGTSLRDFPSSEIFWQYNIPCGENGPCSTTGFPLSNIGYRVRVIHQDTDMALLELYDEAPSGNYMAGFSFAGIYVRDRAPLYRLHHGAAKPLQFWKGAFTLACMADCACDGLPRSRYVYSDTILGDTMPGSSGSALLDFRGVVVGQQYGSCTVDTGKVVDGSLLASRGVLEPIIGPGLPLPAPPMPSQPPDQALAALAVLMREKNTPATVFVSGFEQ